MQVQCVWQEKMRFDGKADGQTVEMDAKAPLGSDAGPTPKQLLLMSVCGCSAMDVIALMKKHKQTVDGFDIVAEADLTQGHPAIFKEIRLTYRLSGQINPNLALEAARLSMTKYCGVSAMVSKASPIHYTVEVNGEICGRGIADFSATG